MSALEPSYEVFAPTTSPAFGVTRTGDALETLDGKTIALLWDWYFKGDEIFEIVKSELSGRYANLTFLGPDLFGSTHGDREDEVIASLPEVLLEHKVDAVISAVGA
jgi:hypothetical protein